MARDAELDRLKMTQDLTFTRQQDAHGVQQRAWEQLSAARAEMNQAYERKQRAYAAQQSSWQDYQRVKSSNGPRIDSLNTQQQRAYENMTQAFQDASNAHDRRDGASARSYADRGHAYKAESQECVRERRRLVDEIRAARARHEPYVEEFKQAKTAFDGAKARFDAAKAAHDRAKEAFAQARAAHESAKAVFRTRLEAVKAARKVDERSAADSAGIPYQYRDNVRISQKPNGDINIYFGGMGTPDGPGHGHYVLDRNGKVTYRRDPFDPHGSQNFTDAQRDYGDVVRGMPVSGEFGFRCRFRGYDAYVESNTNQQGRAKIDIYYGPNGPFGTGHHHAVAYRESPLDFVSDLLR